MQRRILFVFLLALILFLLGGILYTWGTPRLIAFDPEKDAPSVPASAEIRLIFSRPMRDEEVRQRLSIQPALEGITHWEGATLVFTPAQGWPAGQTVGVRLQAGGRAAGLLALPLREAYAWSFTVRTPRLAYLYPSNGPAQLYTMDFQTGETRQLTSSAGEVLDYSIASGGLVIYYAASQGAQGSAILGLELSSGRTHTLLNCPAALCDFARAAPGGSYLAYERTPLSGEGLPQVWLLPLADALTPQADPILVGEPTHPTRQPLWSSGDLLAFYDLDQAAFIFLNPQTGEKSQVSSQSGLIGTWSPDGSSYITPEVFAANISDPTLLPDLSAIPSSHLLHYHPGDGSLLDLTQNDDIEDTSPVFSPDGRLLAFARRYLDQARWTTGRQLWLMQPDGSAARPLTSSPTDNHYNFAWSPTGNQLAFMRFNENTPTELPEIWLINTDGSAGARLLVGGYAPQWIP